jgi:hypothetical protein
VKLNGRSIESRSTSEKVFAQVSMAVEQSCDGIQFLSFVSFTFTTFVHLISFALSQMEFLGGFYYVPFLAHMKLTGFSETVKQGQFGI